MKSIKDNLNSEYSKTVSHLSGDLNSVKRQLANVDTTVSNINWSLGHLSGDLEHHKNMTTPVLADLQLSTNRPPSATTEELRQTSSTTR